MRSAGNFNPEWGYLAPAPSFMRTARVVLVATAIGATAGAAVVISLIDRPNGTGERTVSAAPHAIVTSAQAAPATVVPAVAAAPVVAVPQGAPPVAAHVVTPQPATSAPRTTASAPSGNAPSAMTAPAKATFNATASGNSAPNYGTPVESKPSTGMAALTETSPSTPPSNEAAHVDDAPDQALIPPEPVPDDKKTKHHVASASAPTGKNKPAPNLGSMLRRMFNPHGGTSYYPNR